MTKVGKRGVRIVSITIQWCDDESINDEAPGSPEIAATVHKKNSERLSKNGEILHSRMNLDIPSNKRLLPSDRLVLNALRARVSQGKQVTTPVRIRELEIECEISRRQVQICLKRLSEKGIIMRLLEEASPGSTDGYRYQLSKDILRR